jgi:iron-sulfur cluster repair protein YtfE (RIC family)
MKATLAANQPPARATALARVGDDLVKHLTSEEEVFYPAVKVRSTKDTLLESLEEHLSLTRLLADLLGLDPAADTWEAKFKVLHEQAEHHHKEEEEHLFPEVRKALDAAELDALGAQMLALQFNMQRAGGPSEAVTEQPGEAARLK